jgi:hypothetical protein
MKRVTVQFDVEVPDDATDVEIEEWVSFEIGATCTLSGENSLSDQDLNAVRGSVWVL